MNCMASTSPQSSSPLPSCLEKPLPLDGFQGTPDEVEQQWYDQVYLGSGDRMKQLTWRAVIVGMLLGSILSLTNLYANLKMGWSFGVALTAGIISFALWNAFVRLGISKSPMTILENTCMQSAASSAGYSTGGTLTSAVAALLLLTGQHMPLGTTFAWIFFIAVLGVTMAIPMKRQMINIEQIRFPDSIATAETLKVLYSEGKKAAGQAKALLYSALFAAANAIAMAAGGERWLGTVQQHILGNWYQRTIFFKWDLMFVGAGALVGMKTSLSLFIGGTVCWALYVPWLESQKLLPAGAGYRESVSWTLWGGTACMVVASIVAFLFQWKSIVRSFSSLGAMFSLSKKRKLTDVEKIETPMSWFLTGQLISLGALGYLAHTSFNVPYWMSCIAVVISFFLALVVCRITGEANITPTGAMGKVTQLIFGGIAPGHVTANLMAANITSGASSSSADLLVDLKVGYLLGANPRKQFIAQFSGIFLGTLVSVLAFRSMVPDANALQAFNAPGARTWAATAEALGMGFSHLHSIKVLSIMQGVENIQTVTDALSRMMHLNLDTRKLISVAEEETYLRDYLQIQQYRYAGKFTYSISIEAEAKGHFLPKLLVQPVVENALQHGIAKAQATGIIQIRIFLEQERLHILVRNSGPGFAPGLLDGQHYCGGGSKHIGLQNIDRRLHLLFGDAAETRIFSGEQLLTSVELILPEITESEAEQDADFDRG